MSPPISTYSSAKMAVSARHLHRKNIRNQRKRQSGDAADDSFREDGMHTTPDAQSSDEDIITSEKNSKIARFLFDGDTEDDMPSMRDSDALWLALVMQPMNIRNELIIQLFEALAIFAALFLNGVWILYEWGSARGYGYGGDTNTFVNRIFDFVICIALVLCIFLALSSAMAWILAIMYSSSNDNFVFNTRKLVSYMYGVLNGIVQLVAVGILLGIYINLSPYWPETITSLIIAIGMFIMGAIQTRWIVLSCLPLEHYHIPGWMKISNPVMWISPKQRAKVKKDAMARAEMLKKVSPRRNSSQSSSQANKNKKETDTSLSNLLHAAAENIGMGEYDTSNFETRLRDDWFFEAEHLKGMTVDVLSRYMPYRLAQEVHEQLTESSQYQS